MNRVNSVPELSCLNNKVHLVQIIATGVIATSLFQAAKCEAVTKQSTLEFHEP